MPGKAYRNLDLAPSKRYDQPEREHTRTGSSRWANLRSPWARSEALPEVFEPGCSVLMASVCLLTRHTRVVVLSVRGPPASKFHDLGVDRRGPVVAGHADTVVADAHRKDEEIQDQYGVKYHRYWFNEKTGEVFCLVEAPDKEAAEAVHREAHGLVADELTEVEEGEV